MAKKLESDSQIARPVLKWAGGKGQLLGQLERFWPSRFERYFEPFVGGGAVFFHLFNQGRLPADKSRVFLSDSNHELIELYGCLVSQLPTLCQKLEQHASQHNEDYFYRVRSQNAKRLRSAGRAARMIYLNRTCYNGLHRVNRSGQFNVPYGRYTNPTILDRTRLELAARALSGVQLECLDFERAAQRAAQDDLVYFDPPYVPLSASSSFTAYSGQFGVPEQQRLALLFAELAGRGVRVVLSNSNAELVRELYAGFDIAEVAATRMINSKVEGRSSISELVIHANL